MDEKIKVALSIFGGIGSFLLVIVAFINIFPTRTSARVVEDRLKFDRDIQKDKQANEEYTKLQADRNHWKDRAEKAEKREQDLRDELFTCQDDWHKWKRAVEQGRENRTLQGPTPQAMSGNDTEP